MFQVVSSGESSVVGECFGRDLSLLHVSGTCQTAQTEVRDGEENPLSPPPHFICWDIFLELLGFLDHNVDSYCSIICHLSNKQGNTSPNSFPQCFYFDSQYLLPSPLYSSIHILLWLVGPLTQQSSWEGSWQHCDVEEHCKGGWGQRSYGWASSHSQETMSRDAPLDTKMSIGEFISGFKQSSPSYGREFNSTLY